MGSVLQARGYNVTVIDPVKNLLAQGHYLESTVDIPESYCRILGTQYRKDDMIFNGRFYCGNEKMNSVGTRP